MGRSVYLVVLLCYLHYYIVVADYECICNYNVEKSVLPAPDLTSQPLGYMYEFDCKPSVQAPNVDSSNWQAVAFEHGIGYVAVDPNIQSQICQGSPSSYDILTTTTTTTQYTTPTTTSTTKSTTIRTTTPKLIITQSTLKPTIRTTTPKPTTQTTKPKPTTRTTTPKSTSRATPSNPTTRTTTPMPTTQTTTPMPPTQTTTPKPTTQTTTPKPTTQTTTPKPTTKTITPKPTIQTTTPKPTTQTTTQKPTTQTTTPKPTTQTTTQKPTTQTTTLKPTTRTSTTTLPPTTVDPIRGNTFLCSPQVEATSQADRTPLGQHKTSCYELIMTYKSSWSNAESKCKQRGGHLVDINDADEQKFITKFLLNFTPNHAVWIGLNDVKSEGKFSWSSGSSVTYYNWYPGHANDFLSHNVEDCAVIIPYKNGQWDDLPCITYHNTPVNYAAFCEYKIPQ